MRTILIRIYYISQTLMQIKPSAQLWGIYGDHGLVIRHGATSILMMKMTICLKIIK